MITNCPLAFLYYCLRHPSSLTSQFEVRILALLFVNAWLSTSEWFLFSLGLLEFEAGPK